MGKTSSKIIRRSIFTFLQKYQYFTTTSALFSFPFSVSVLLSQTFVLTSLFSLFPIIFEHLKTLFDAAGFPTSFEFFSIFIQKLSQTISSSILTLPFTLTFLLIAKAFVIRVFEERKSASNPSFSSIRPLFNSLLLTHICNTLLILSANATVFSIFFFAFNCLDGFGLSSSSNILLLSAAGAVLYSIVLANAMVICNLALVLSGMENLGGYLAVLKACVLIRGRTSTALLLALPVNLAMAATEALFQYRVVRAYLSIGKPSFSMLFEGIFIAYLHSVFVVLDTIVNCLFFKSCKRVYWVDLEGRQAHQMDFTEANIGDYVDSKIVGDLPSKTSR